MISHMSFDSNLQMNQLTLPITICVLLWLFSSQICVCAYDKFNKCAPRACGDGGLNISYPFYIRDLQPSYCGQPGFDLSCATTNSSLILSTPSLTVHMQEINYQNHSFLVTKAEISVKNCNFPERNLTLTDMRFNIKDNSSLFVYSKCNTQIPNNLTPCSYNCSDPVLVMFSSDSHSVYASKECQNMVRMPVEVFEEELQASAYGADWGVFEQALNRGFTMNWTASNCSGCVDSGGRCGFDEEAYSFQCYCSKRAHSFSFPPNVPHTRSGWKMIVSIGGSVAGLGIAIVVILLLLRQKRRQDPQYIINFLQDSEFLAPKRFKYSEIRRMTCSFKDKLGQGGFGIVYKGVLKDGRLVAVKVLNTAKSSDGEDFMNEVASISKTSHVNVVSLLGFCISRTRRALVYEFVANRSLEKFIHEGKSSEPNRLLSWDKLHTISVGIAQGLEYLHRGCNTRILHFDIKPHNILLDEDFYPKISDFSLAKVCKLKESVVSMSGARGTVGYIAPEQVCRNFGPVSHKSDVYSYGMMILEMVGGRKNVESGVANASAVYFPHWIYTRVQAGQELELNGILEEGDNINARKMVLVGLWCIQTDPANRPPMSQVVNMLQGSIAALSIPPNPYLYSQPNSGHFSYLSSFELE